MHRTRSFQRKQELAENIVKSKSSATVDLWRNLIYTLIKDLSEKNGTEQAQALNRDNRFLRRLVDFLGKTRWSSERYGIFSGL